MSPRDKIVIKVALELLARMDHCQVEILFYSVGQIVPKLLMGELEFALKYCQSESWASAVKGKLETDYWSITHQGKAAVLDM